MGAVYATVADIRARGKSLTAAEEEAAETLLSDASAMLRIKAKQFGQGIDALIESDEDYGASVKNVVIQAVIRALDSISADNNSTVTQATETLGAYSYSMTYANAGQSLYFSSNELKDLGFRRQRYGVLPPLFEVQESDPP